jgi:hypothetical protein
MKITDIITESDEPVFLGKERIMPGNPLYAQLKAMHKKHRPRRSITAVGVEVPDGETEPHHTIGMDEPLPQSVITDPEPMADHPEPHRKVRHHLRMPEIEPEDTVMHNWRRERYR